MDFWRTVDILAKRKWLIVTSVLLTSLLTLAASRLVGARWMATVRLMSVTPPAPASTTPGEAQPPEAGAGAEQSHLQASAYLALAKTGDVIRLALAKAGLGQLRPTFLKDLEVEAKGSRYFELHVYEQNPQRAEALANALAEGLVERNDALYAAQAERVVKLLQQQRQQSDAHLAELRRKYDLYRRQHHIVTDLNDELTPALARLHGAREQRDEVTQRLSEARARLAARQAELAGLPRTVAVQRPPDANPLVKQLEEELAKTEEQLTVLRAKYTDSKIEVKQALATRDALDARLRAELAKAPRSGMRQRNPELDAVEHSVRELRQEITGEQAQLAALTATVDGLEKQIGGYSGIDTPLTQMLTEITRETENATALAARLQTAGVALDAARRQSSLSIVDPAGDFNPAVNTTAGRTVKLLLLGFLCSLVGICGLIIAFDSVDRRLRTVREAEIALPTPLLTAIPAPMGSITAGALARVTESEPLSPHSEAYHFLGMHLLSTRGKTVRSLMALSVKADQGSTNMIANLGISLAQAGKRVILVDANVRTPKLHTVFEMDNGVGLSTLLANPDPATLEVALQPTSVRNLRVVASGPACENPWELFRSRHLAEVTRRLRDLADYVLYDTPSALAFTDALNLAMEMDAAFLCVRALEPPSGAEQRLVEMLTEAGVTVLGGVLSDVPASVLESYRNHQRYYTGSGDAGAVSGGSASTATASSRIAEWVQIAGAEDPGKGGNGTNGFH